MTVSFAPEAPCRPVPAPGVRVVRITTRMNVGGIARHVSWLSAGLEPMGYRTTLVAGVVPAGEDDMTDFARSMGVEPLVLSEMSREISWRDALTVWKLYRLFRTVRPEVVHTHAAKAGTVGRVAGFLYRWLTPGVLLGRPRNCRFVHTYHGHVFHSYYGPWKTRFFLLIERLLARLATDRIVVISRQQFEEIHHTFRVGRAGQFRVIPLGLDLGIFDGWRQRRRAFREELGLGNSDLLVGIVGRLTEIKNHRLFLEAAARLKGRAPAGCRVRVVVIGDGHLRGGLEQACRDLGLEGQVSFVGMRDDPEVFYPALDVVAITSLNEGTPLTLIEGMACARPFVATAVGGVVDLAGGGIESETGPGWAVRERGVVVRPSDPEAFADALATLLADAPLRDELGRRGLEFVQSCYGKDRLLVDVASLYRSLTGGGDRDGAGSLELESVKCVS